ncbi:MutS protein 4 [Schistosoma japonicum]|nr:MutS protein 4 [Schistosoma japonicum]
MKIRELTYVLQNFTSSSIILIDGLCHTNPPVLFYSEAFTFLATNRYELSSLASVYPNVENYYFSMQEEFVNMYDGHQTGRLNQSTYEVSFGNNSNTIEESPLVHSFSNDLNCTKVNKQLNNYDVGQITFTYKLNKGLSPKLMYDRAEELLNLYTKDENVTNDGGENDDSEMMISSISENFKHRNHKNKCPHFLDLQCKIENNHTDLDEITPNESVCSTTTANLGHELNSKINKTNGCLTVNDRLEHELFRQLQIISKAYQTLNTIQYLSSSEKENIENEILNYLKFLKFRCQTLFNKPDMMEE